MAIELRRVAIFHCIFVTLATAVAMISPQLEAMSLILGGLFMGINLLLLHYLAGAITRAVVEPPGSVALAMIIGAFVLKFSIFLALVLLLFKRVPVDGPSFGLGVTLLLVACVLEAALKAAKGVG